MYESKHDIHERIYQFILHTLRSTRKFPRTLENQTIIGQLVRSLTSMGANGQEADGSLTRADFIHCFVIVRKEGKEALFWIRLLGDLNEKYQEESKLSYKEGDEILSIVSSIVFNAKKNT